jgi:hypothetical protein
MPDPIPPIRRGPCPDYLPQQFSCCDHPRNVWLNRWDWKHRPTLYHELTHWFDFQYLTPEDREEIRLHFGWPELPWWHYPGEKQDPLCEYLARVGTRMYLHPNQYRWLRRKFRAAKARGG